MLQGVGQGQDAPLLQTTTFPEEPRQANQCALTDYYSGEARKHPVPSSPPRQFNVRPALAPPHAGGPPSGNARK